MAYRAVPFTADGGRYYPGTEREIIVTLPDSDSITDAALFVGLDGILCNAPEVIDSLTKASKMPPTVGVYIQPGVIKNAQGEVVRYNRSNEFDAIDSRFADYLIKCILPRVKEIAAANGIALSEDSQQRMIFGLSSGGIAAFNAAWHRPEAFGKVFSGCGTFVPMRGGEEIQVLVRKSEPRNIKVFLQDGYSDTWNPLFGSWYEANRQLGSALEFAGYDCAFDWAEGGHSVRRANEIFSSVMQWMWQNDSLLSTPTKNDFLAPRLIAGEDWEKVQYQALPLNTFAIYPGGGLKAFRKGRSNNLWQCILGPDGAEQYSQRFYWLHSLDGAPLELGGLAFDAEGYLWAVTSAGLQACDQNGRVRGILRLPDDIDIAKTAISITDGGILLSDGDKTYSRALNILAPKGRPKSQGQG